MNLAKKTAWMRQACIYTKNHQNKIIVDNFLFHHKKFKRKEEKTMLFSLHERGQGMVEYALILVLMALVVITALTIMGPIIKNTYSTINSKL